MKNKKTTDAEDLKKIFKKCLNVVKKKEFTFFNFKKLRGYQGSCNWDDIDIDPRKEFIPTAIHECLHYLYPDWTETKVLKIEKNLMNQIDYFELSKFLKHLSSKIYKNELHKKLKRKKS